MVQQVKILGIVFKRNISDQEQYQANFEPYFTKIKQTCKAWANRILSLKGKIIVIKSLVVSLLQYPCSCTNTPSRVFSEFKKIMLDFIWSAKRSKIAYAVMIQDIDHGGLGLPDLELRVATALTKWIDRIWANTESAWAQVLKFHLQTPDIKKTLLSKTNLASSLSVRLPFLKQILHNWAKLHIYEPWTEDGVRQERIWSNDFITVGGNTILWQEWEEAGISCINDLWHPSLPRFLSDQEIRDSFGVRCSFLNLLQIRSALPATWKRLLVNVSPQSLTPRPHIFAGHQTDLDITGASSKRIYKALVLLKLPPIASQKKWNETFQVEEHSWKEHWQPIYKRPFQSVRDTKLQAFQHKLIHRIIPCNKYLSNIRIKQEDSCPNCGEQDTLPHFFYHCSLVHDFWTKITEWLLQNANFDLNPSLEEILFGRPIRSSSDKISNFLFILTKFFIYRQRLFHDTDLNLLHILMELRSKIKVEKYICELEGKPYKANMWNPILQALG